MSPIGEAVTRLPPSVARLRIWREPNTHNILAHSGKSFSTKSARSVSFSPAPRCQLSFTFLALASSATASIETRIGNFLNPLAISTPISVAPAINRAPDSLFKIAKSSFKLPGRKNFSPFCSYSKRRGCTEASAKERSNRSAPFSFFCWSATKAASQIGRYPVQRQRFPHS